MESISFKLQGQTWKAKILPDKKFEAKSKKIFGSIVYAWTETDARLIYLRYGQLTFETIVHELIHALIAESGQGSMELKRAQYEEWMCEVISKQLDVIYNVANLILSRGED